MHTLPFTHGERSVSAALFDALWDAPVGIALLDCQLRYVRVNPTLARLNGRPIDEHIGRQLEEVAPQVATSLSESLGSVIRTGEPVTGVLLSGRAEATDLAVRHWLANHYPIRAPSGRVIGVGSVVVEITDRKRMEERAEEARQRAEQGAALLQAFIDHVPAGLALLDRDLRLVRVNHALAAMSGLPPEAHLGRTLEEAIPAGRWDELHARIRSVLDAGEPVLDLDLCGQGPPAGNPPKHYLASLCPVRSDRRVIGVGLMMHDVSERRRVEELQQLIVGIVGHDLRSPLSAILGSAKLLPRSGELTERQARLVARIESSAARMESIARDLLDFTRARSARGIPVTPRPVDMDDICRAAIEEAEASVPGCAIQYAPDGDGCGEWDPDRLGQLLGNLLHNALTHGEPGAPVALRWQGGASHLVVRVENCGRPIPADAIPQLFEPFGQLATPRGRRAGVGLGLFIAREIARAHGGSIDVTSNAARTVVAARLPRRAAAAGP